jgi:hypothetical protein
MQELCHSYVNHPKVTAWFVYTSNFFLSYKVLVFLIRVIEFNDDLSVFVIESDTGDKTYMLRSTATFLNMVFSHALECGQLHFSSFRTAMCKGLDLH